MKYLYGEKDEYKPSPTVKGSLRSKLGKTMEGFFKYG
jgi:hypothetical protein